MKDDAKQLFLFLADGGMWTKFEGMHKKRVEFLWDKWLKGGLIDKVGDLTAVGKRTAQEMKNQLPTPTFTGGKAVIKIGDRVISYATNVICYNDNIPARLENVPDLPPAEYPAVTGSMTIARKEP